MEKVKKNPSFYPNLVGEMAKVGITQRELAKKTGRTQGTMSQKLSGKAKLTIDECFVIKRIIGSKLPLDILFSHEVI